MSEVQIGTAPDGWLKTVEVMRRTGLDRRTVTQMVRRGKLVGMKANTLKRTPLYIEPESIERFLVAPRRGPRGPYRKRKPYSTAANGRPVTAWAENGWLTTPQAARRLRCDKSWPQKLVREGLLVATKVGNRLKIDPASVEQYLATHKKRRTGAEIQASIRSKAERVAEMRARTVAIPKVASSSGGVLGRLEQQLSAMQAQLAVVEQRLDDLVRFWQ